MILEHKYRFGFANPWIYIGNLEMHEGMIVNVININQDTNTIYYKETNSDLTKQMNVIAFMHDFRKIQ